MSISLPTDIYLNITASAGFDRDYERHCINEEVRTIFEKEVQSVKKVLFYNRASFYDYATMKGIETVQNDNNGRFKMVAFEFRTDGAKDYFTDEVKFMELQ